MGHMGKLATPQAHLTYPHRHGRGPRHKQGTPQLLVNKPGNSVKEEKSTCHMDIKPLHNLTRALQRPWGISTGQGSLHQALPRLGRALQEQLGFPCITPQEPGRAPTVIVHTGKQNSPHMRPHKPGSSLSKGQGSSHLGPLKRCRCLSKGQGLTLTALPKLGRALWGQLLTLCCNPSILLQHGRAP